MDLAERLQVRQVAEDLRQQPVRVLLRERVAVDVRHDLEHRQLGCSGERPRARAPGVRRRARGCPGCARERRRRCVRARPGTGARRAARRRRASSGIRRRGRASSRSRSTARCAPAGGRRRSAGAARAGTGRRARARAPASRRRSTRRGRCRCPTPASRSRSGSIGPAIPESARAALGGVAAQRLLGHAALAGDLQAPREHRLGVLDHAVQVLVVGVHPHLAAGALDDRRAPARSGRCARACTPPAAPARGAGCTSRARARGGRASPARACRCRTARSRRRARPPRRCSGERPATAAAGAGGNRPGSTRSPRPSSRLLSTSGMARRLDYARSAA